MAHGEGFSLRVPKTPKSEGFGAVAGDDAKVLILGSLPGQESLKRGKYYAHPRNAFWPIMGKLFGASPDLPYPDRICRLIVSGIALWDVCASARRPGSLDSKISAVVPNDFSAFLSRHPHVKLICFNGTKAAKIYRRRVIPNLTPNFAEIRRELLPSTGPAYAAMPFEEKLKRWRDVLGSGLRGNAAPRTSFEFRVSNFAER